MAFLSGVLIQPAIFFLCAGLLGRPGLGQAGFGPGRDQPRGALPAASLVRKTQPKTKTQDPGQGHWLGTVHLIWSLGRSRLVSGRKQRPCANRCRLSRQGDDRARGHPSWPCDRDRSVLPFLRRGRLDSDPRVRPLAAEGLGSPRFRGKPAVASLPPATETAAQGVPHPVESADPGFRDRCALRSAAGRSRTTGPGPGCEKRPPTANGPVCRYRHPKISFSPK